MRYLGPILLGLGLFISAYLLHRHFELIGGADGCSALFGIGCDEALQSDLSYQFGLPLAGWGVVYYVTLLSLLLGPFVKAGSGDKKGGLEGGSRLPFERAIGNPAERIPLRLRF